MRVYLSSIEITPALNGWILTFETTEEEENYEKRKHEQFISHSFSGIIERLKALREERKALFNEWDQYLESKEKSK